MRDDPTRRKHAYDFVVRVEADDGGVRLWLHKVENLSVPEEGLHANVNHVLEDKVFIVVAHCSYISFYHVVESCLPTIEILRQILKMVYLTLTDLSVKYFLVDLASDGRRNASLSILHQVRLVVFLEEALADERPLLDEVPVLIWADLSQGHA